MYLCKKLNKYSKFVHTNCVFKILLKEQKCNQIIKKCMKRGNVSVCQKDHFEFIIFYFWKVEISVQIKLSRAEGKQLMLNESFSGCEFYYRAEQKGKFFY